MMKHRWSYDEDKLCCLKCLLYAMEGKGHDIRPLLDDLCDIFPHIKRSSLQMKISNIKQLFIEYGVEASLDMSPLTQYSRQCEQAFLDSLRGEE